MSGQEAFGPNLRRLRVQRGISLDEIARHTKVSAELWDGLERNDFSRWPTGIFARAYIREYAHAIGVDPETTVDEFCRWFRQGDRRAERIVRGQAQLVGHALHWSDDLSIPDRRVVLDPVPPSESASKTPSLFSPQTRALIALADLVAIAVVAAAISWLVPVGFWVCVGGVALAYHLCALAALGASPAVALVDWHLSARRPGDAARPKTSGLRLLRGSERVKV